MALTSDSVEWSKKRKSAKTALTYISNIADKMPMKLKLLTKPTEEFRIMFRAEESYDSDGIDLAMKTFQRKNINGRMTRYKKLTSGKYGYIFAFSRAN